jgi:hypothetical protein
MTQQEIKENCTTAYADIKAADEMLEAMRGICKHPETFEGDYSWRIGCIDKATICSDCGAVINFANRYKIELP